MEDEITVNQHTEGRQEDQRLVELGNGEGDFAVIWWGNKDADGSRGGIFGRIFDKDINPKGNEFIVNSYRTGDQVNSM